MGPVSIVQSWTKYFENDNKLAKRWEQNTKIARFLDKIMEG